MSFKNYVFAVLMFSSFSILASEGGVISNANRNDVRYIKNTKRLPDVAYQQELRERDAWKNFMSANGTWYVIFNEENARPHRAFGKPVNVFGMDPQSRAMNFINSKLTGFNIPMSELQLRGTSSSQSFQYVHFDQVHSGYKVLNSDLYVKMTQGGSVISFGCDVYTDISIPSSATLSASDAIAAAATGIIDPVTGSSINPDLFILPIPEFKQNVYKLVYEVHIKTLDASGVPADYLTLVDAATGTVLSRTNQVKHFGEEVTDAHPAPVAAPAPPPAATDITITGTLYDNNPYAGSSVQPLRNLKMVESSTTYHTDNLGYIGLTASSPTSVTFTLEGLWSKVVNSGSTPSYTTTVNPGTNTLSFDSDAIISELSAYFHVNIIHDYMKTKFPSFTDMDSPLTTNVELTTGTCNAFYNGISINFYQDAGGCNSLAKVGDVVYHEYGHGINDQFYSSIGGSFNNGGMNEGYADVWALGITNNPVLGTGMDDADPLVHVRRYDINKKVYPQDLIGEVHADGEIIAGAWWDTNLNFGDLQQMMDLYKETFYATVSGPDGTEGQVYVDVLIEALTSDDVPANGGDNDITNGTPNDNAIIDAFALHGITLLSNAIVTHTAVASSPALSVIPINANVTVTYAWALVDVKMFYKLNRLGAWTGVAMTNTGGSAYTASIPAQPQGTVIGYYIGLEGTTGALSAVKPISADLPNPNIPYYILNGVALMDEEDFDVNFGAWSEGVSGDDATTGMWEVAIPVGSYFTPGDPSTVVQPGTQHTAGGSYCAVTQNAPSSTSALGTNDVDGGHSTLESPNYDLTTYTNPIFTYYRWYINNPPSGANPGNDFWEVMISNDGGSTWSYIERTNVSDKSWRRFAFRVADYVTLTANTKIRFIVDDSIITGATLNGGSLVEAGIDDVYLYEEAMVGIDEDEAVASVNIYPNPATSMVNVSFDLLKEEDVVIEMRNNIGQIVYTQSLNGSVGKHQLKISTDDLSAGLYMLNIKTGKQDHLKKVAVMK